MRSIGQNPVHSLVLDGFDSESLSLGHIIMAERSPNLFYCCEICGQEGLKDEEMRTHMLVAHIEGAISCPFCDLSDISAEEMFVHVNSLHLDFMSPDDEENGKPERNGDAGLDNPGGACGSSGNGRPVGGRRNHNYPLSSPQRSKLSLNLKQEHKFNGRVSDRSKLDVINHEQVLTCPICEQPETSAERLEEHVNRQHFDLTSPSFPAVSPLEGLDVYNCPLCVRRYQSVSDLELHVNMEHRDILSPAKPSRITPADENSNQSCPICNFAGFLNAREMASHIEEHFERKPTLASPEIVSGLDVSADCLLAQEIEKQEHEARKMREQKEFELLKAQYGMDNHGSFKDQSLTNMQKAVYSGEMSVADYYNRQVELRVAEMNGVDDGHSCTKGLIPKIRIISTNNNNVLGVWQCTTVDHYGSTYGDKGWGCGYRNIQMMLSSLMHHTGYNEKLFNGENVIPSISKLQELIEWSWRKGFDPQGCEQLGGKLCNTRKWIGATEVVTFLSSFRLRCQLVDFHRPTGPDGTHPILFQWVLEYFQKQDDFKPPLYLQHQGHSRTIVGVELLKDGGVRLLVFDPSHSKTQMEHFGNTATSANGMRLIRRPLVAMKARQYQIVAVAGIIETDQEFQINITVPCSSPLLTRFRQRKCDG